MSKSMTDGLQFLMNNSTTNPFTPHGKKAFDEVLKASGMTTSKALEYIGKQSKTPKVTDKQRSQERLEKLETETGK